MRGFLVIFTLYCEASSQSILIINAQGTRHLSQSILELIKYTKQDAQDKLINARIFFSFQRTKQVIDQQINFNAVIETLRCSYKICPLHVLAASCTDR
jgi:predicted proteasome-type protease